MKIIYFIRLLQRHILLLILVPLIIALVVFLLTRKSQWSYSSETTIYTGVTSGYSVQQQANIDFMATAASFDNLINLIKARQTLEEVSVSLLAQHLLLDHYDPRFISKENYEDLLLKVPADVIDIVKKAKRNDKRYYRPPSKRTSSLDTALYQNDLQEEIASYSQGHSSLNNSKKFHVVRRGETMYSIAKTNGLRVDELMTYNNLQENDLTVGQKLILNNNENLPEASPTPDEGYEPEPSPASQNSGSDSATRVTDFFYSSDTLISASRGIQDSSAFDRIVRRLLAYGHQNNYNFIYKLWSSEDDRFYSIKVLSTIGIYRVQSSDLIKLTYTNPDPGICQQTLIFLTRVFIANYKLLKQNQTDAVIQYFKRQLEDAARRLKKAENDLLIFNERNNIINYYEQTKIIAITKEELDVSLQNKQISFASSDAAIKIIEKKLEAHAKISLNTSAILRLRNELSETTMQIANIEIDLGNDSATIQQLAGLKSRVENIKLAIKNNIDRLYLITNTVEGLPTKELLDAWLKNVIAYEESRAAFRVLAERKKYFQHVYEVFAPLGAEMKRIERLIGVTESEFLQLLHDLSLAKLRQQDDELRTNIKVVDPPYYPLNPIRSRALLLVLAAAVVGFILIVAILLAMEFFDTTIKTPERAERFIKLKVAGVYPQIAKQIYDVDIGFIIPRLVEILAQNIKLTLVRANLAQDKKPIMILLFSTRDAEGKTSIGRELSRKLKSFGENVLFLNYVKETGGGTAYMMGGDLIPPNDDEIQYSIRENFFETKDLASLMVGYEHIDLESIDYLIVEIPSLINNPYPLEFIQQFDLSLIVTRANRSWTMADNTALNAFLPLCKQNTQIVLNGVELLYLDDIFGELPRPRSKFRRKAKQILTFRFREKNII
ncbi:MAG: LysM peptidoglycan-binding domain-containing protein [Bacteroidota bacterium]